MVVSGAIGRRRVGCQCGADASNRVGSGQGAPNGHAQDIRYAEVLLSGPVADAFDSHRWEWAGAVGEATENECAGRRQELRPVLRRVHRDSSTAQEFEGGRAGNGENAIPRIDEAASDIHRGDTDRGYSKRFEAGD